MVEYSLPMAIEDFLPVIFTAAGVLLLARLCWRRDAYAGMLALVGGLLVTAGGLGKAVWILLQALGGPDVVWMRLGLFWMLGPGFTCLAWALWAAGRVQGPARVLGPPLVVVAGALIAAVWFALQSTSGWRTTMLTLTTIANVAMSVLLITRAWRQRLRLASLLFLVNLLTAFVLAGMAAVAVRTTAFQWTEQTVSAAAALGFALASWWLLRYEAGVPTRPRAVPTVPARLAG